MATFIFDGSTSLTASKADAVVISANPANFTNVADVGANTVFSFSNGNTLTITGTNFGPNATSFPNVSLAGGTFSTASAGTLAPATANDLIIAPSAGIGTVIDVSAGGAVGGVKAVFGGVGVSDSIDGQDSINIGGQGSFLIYGNAGNDSVSQSVAFDSSSFVTAFGGKGADSIILTTGAVNAKMAIYGGETDSISIVNTGSNAVTTIFGGQGAADSTDGADTILFNGGGTVNIFGNAGADTITLGGNTALDSTTVAVIHGGRDSDNITATVATNVKATLSIFGDENTDAGADSISVTGNAGTTVIYGGVSAADSLDGADSISYSGQGTATIYAAGGNDSIQLTGNGGTAADSTSTTTVFAGNGSDSITITGQLSTTGTVSITGGAGADKYTVGVADTPAAGANPAVAGATGGVGQGVTIADFAIGTGNDTLLVQNGITTAQATLNLVTGSFQTLQQALDAASATANTVSAVVYSGSTYVVANNGTTGFIATADLAIKLTGVTDLAGVQAATTII